MNTLTERNSDEYNEIYESYNNFIISKDLYCFSKMISRINIFNKIINIPGDIFDCGVFKGSSFFTFVKLLSIYSPNSIKKVIGFDLFDIKEFKSNNISDVEDKSVSDFLQLAGSNDNYYDIINNVISSNILFQNNMIIKGDVSKTIRSFFIENPGCRISLLHLDLDKEEPTRVVLDECWDRISKGGIILCDEYGIHKWNESDIIDTFLSDKQNYEIISINTSESPTAYIIKM